jgi:hypothetical protein
MPSTATITRLPVSVHEDRDQPERAVLRLPVLLVERGVQFVVARLAPERLDGADAAERLGEVHDQRGDRLAGAPVGRRRVPLEPARDDEQHREGEQRHPAQQGIQDDEHDADRHDAEQRREQVVQALVEQLLERLHVAGQPADRAPGGVALVEGQRQPLHVREHPPAQFEQHGLPDPPRPADEGEPQHGVQRRRGHHRAGDADQRPGVAVPERGDRDVDAEADEERPGQPRRVLHQDRDQQAPQRRVMRREQAAEQPAGAGAQEQAGGGRQLVVLLGGDAPPALLDRRHGSASASSLSCASRSR